MIIDITCRTDRFNLSVVGADFINDCCFGEDFSRWLVGALRAAGYSRPFRTVRAGIDDYLDALGARPRRPRTRCSSWALRG